MDQSAGGPWLGLAELLEALASSDPAVRARAIARARLSPGAEDVLIEALGDPDPDVRREAVRALARTEGRRATGALLEVSSGDVSVAVRAEAVAALGRILLARGGPEEPPEPGAGESGGGDQGPATG
jgi:HEAT repeat protein